MSKSCVTKTNSESHLPLFLPNSITPSTPESPLSSPITMSPAHVPNSISSQSALSSTIPLVHEPYIPQNTHPMTTRSKNGISRPKSININLPIRVSHEPTTVQ